MLDIPPYILVFFSSGGENIKSINQQSGAHVELQRNPPPNTDPGVRIFTIRGVPQQIELARHLIDEKVGVSSISDLSLVSFRHGVFTLRYTWAWTWRMAQNTHACIIQLQNHLPVSSCLELWPSRIHWTNLCCGPRRI